MSISTHNYTEGTHQETLKLKQLENSKFSAGHNPNTIKYVQKIKFLLHSQREMMYFYVLC